METVEAVETVHETVEQPEEQVEHSEFIVYQEELGDCAEQYYTETIVSEPAPVETETMTMKPVRIKNKRTVAAVSEEDKNLAMNAMEELRAR